ncbi:RES family NAD+ phosphorylase [Polaromonas sp. SM01]|uniref:RES family NAD+ phosphorylase n=1 Tax=Polaromonas sp. SM01 TaxID=3085630 RepID=UPI0029812722|nr:RES family NAD+ phosphorylase [Polaromonas sp. SM01]MDW5442044.1 RES family NAD+ phosphorylase [Polaromonas sp. SM01]
MNFHDFHPPIIEIPAHQGWHRVQRKTARRDSVRLKGYVLAPPGVLAGRFDLADEPTAYLADSPETALYESLFRREVRSCSWGRIEQRMLVGFETQAYLRLADLRGLEERYPVLQSMRYETSQTFAQDCRRQDLHGILYASAQHPSHGCLCLFKAGIERTRKTSSIALVQQGVEVLHKAVVAAARGSQVPIIREER